MNEEENVDGSETRVSPGDGNVDNQTARQRWRTRG